MSNAQTNLAIVFSTIGSSIGIFIVIAIIASVAYKITRRFELTTLTIVILGVLFGFLGFGWIASFIASGANYLLVTYYNKNSRRKA
jgi:hypothetical protein